MNIWLAKLGKNRFESINGIQNLLINDFNNTSEQSLVHFEYKTTGVHFISYDFTRKGSGKNYHYVDSANRLTAYSGLLVNNNPDNQDFRDAKTIHEYSENPQFFDSNITGNYSVVSASETGFQCIVDNLGIHRVFYLESSDGHVYVSNYLKLLKLFKEPEINKSAFLDWLALETILSYETEEKDVYTLPYYGRLSWSQNGNKLHIDQYKDVSDLVYNDTPVNTLFDKVVSDFRSTAKYLLKYHNITATISGGYDSRLVLKMFWGLNIGDMDSYSFYDNYYDVKVAKKFVKDFGIKHRVIDFSKELPTLEQLHSFLLSVQQPYFKYSDVFSYMVMDSLKDMYPDDKHRVLLKGTGGNSDRRIIEKKFLDDFDGEEAIGKLADHFLMDLDTNLFKESSMKLLSERLQSHYTTKYQAIIKGRKKDHQLKHLLYKERYEELANRVGPYNQSLWVDSYIPLTMDSFQTLLFNCDEKKLHRGNKGSIYHKLTNALTKGKDKPIHFSSGLHWEASKLSRAAYRLQHQVIERKIRQYFDYKVKGTTVIKGEFHNQNKGLVLDIINGNSNSFLWDYFNKDHIVRQFSKTDIPDNSTVRYTFKHIIPILKQESDGLL